MIRYVTGNLLEADTQAYVNTVNTVGVMGKGVALLFRESFPHNYKLYRKAVENHEVRTGKMFVTENPEYGNPHYIINFPTKEHWRNPSKLEYITEGLYDLKKIIIEKNIQSIAIPPIGSGNGGLKWEEVKTEIEKILGDLPASIIIYQPSEEIKKILAAKEKKGVELTSVRAMLLWLLYHYRVLGESPTEFAAEKLSYFLQRFGEKQLKLDFTKNYYGPYSGKVRHVLYAMNGYYIKGLEQRDFKPFEPFFIVSEKFNELQEYIENKLNTDEKLRLKTVLNFIEGFESPLGLELLSSVDFIMQKENLNTDPEIIKAIQTWNERKAQVFQQKHIQIAIDHVKKSVSHFQN